jgi:hypothetical protein
MDIWLQMYELGVYLVGGVFVAVAVGAFIWFKCFRNEIGQ